MLNLTGFLNKNQELVMAMWIKGVEEVAPDQHNVSDLLKNGKQYYRLLIDHEIPIEQRPSFQIIPTMCEFHASHNTPIEHILHSSHIWRQCLVKLIHEFLVKERINPEDAMPFFESLHNRIDRLQRIICQHYWQFAKKLVKEHEEKINELHEDRLNLLGKMAASMAHEIKTLDAFLTLSKTFGCSISSNRYFIQDMSDRSHSWKYPLN